VTVPLTSAAAMSAAIEAVCRVFTQDGMGVELVVVAVPVVVEETVVVVAVADVVAVELTAEKTPEMAPKGIGFG
jgi:hypothetical protein